MIYYFSVTYSSLINRSLEVMWHESWGVMFLD